MYFNQIPLERYSRTKNISFFKELHASKDLKDVHKWFDYHAFCGIGRLNNDAMTLEKFTEILFKSLRRNIIGIGLQVGSPDENRITHFIRLINPNGDCAENFSWIQCKYTPENYRVVKGIFTRAYEFDLETIKIPKCLIIYHESLKDYKR